MSADVPPAGVGLSVRPQCLPQIASCVAAAFARPPDAIDVPPPTSPSLSSTAVAPAEIAAALACAHQWV